MKKILPVLALLSSQAFCGRELPRKSIRVCVDSDLESSEYRNQVWREDAQGAVWNVYLRFGLEGKVSADGRCVEYTYSPKLLGKNAEQKRSSVCKWNVLSHADDFSKEDRWKLSKRDFEPDEEFCREANGKTLAFVQRCPTADGTCWMGQDGYSGTWYAMFDQDARGHWKRDSNRGCPESENRAEVEACVNRKLGNK